MATKPPNKFAQMAKEAGFLADESLIEFGELVARQCVELCADACADVQNGDIFAHREKDLLSAIKAGQVGLVADYAGRQISEHFGLK
jgi:hypothetical protein